MQYPAFSTSRPGKVAVIFFDTIRMQMQLTAETFLNLQTFFSEMAFIPWVAIKTLVEIVVSLTAKNY